MGRRWARFWRKFDRSGGWRFWWFPVAVVGILLLVLGAFLAGELGYMAKWIDWIDRLVR